MRSNQFPPTIVLFNAFGNLEAAYFSFASPLAVQHQAITFYVKDFRAFQLHRIIRNYFSLCRFPFLILGSNLLHNAGYLLMAYGHRSQGIDCCSCYPVYRFCSQTSYVVFQIGCVPLIFSDTQLLVQRVNSLFAFFFHPSAANTDCAIACL